MQLESFVVESTSLADSCVLIIGNNIQWERFLITKKNNNLWGKGHKKRSSSSLQK